MPLPISSPVPPPPISPVLSEVVVCNVKLGDRVVDVWHGSVHPLKLTEPSQGRVKSNLPTKPLPLLDSSNIGRPKPSSSVLRCYWDGKLATTAQGFTSAAPRINPPLGQLRISPSISQLPSTVSPTPSPHSAAGLSTVSPQSPTQKSQVRSPLDQRIVSPEAVLFEQTYLLSSNSPGSQPTPSPSPPAATPSPTPRTTVPLNGNGNGNGNGSRTTTQPRVIELTADRQDYDAERRVVTAVGRVVMKFGDSVLVADHLQVNLPEQLAVATGKVTLTRQDQILQGARFEYNYLQDRGRVLNARGSINLQTANSDFRYSQPNDAAPRAFPDVSLSTRLNANQPSIKPKPQPSPPSTTPTPSTSPLPGQTPQTPQNITSSGDLTFSTGVGENYTNNPGDGTGTVNRLRFEAEQVDFFSDGWDAVNVRVTNDPFSPPEFELRANRARLVRFSRTQDELTAFGPKFVFDQTRVLPLPRTRLLLDREQRNPIPLGIGVDGRDRGGVYLEWTLDPYRIGKNGRFTFTPQFMLQRAIADRNFDITDPSVYGFVTRLDYPINSRLSLEANASLSSLDLNDFENQFRASVRARQLVGTHSLALDYSYRDRLFNGSLGFQDVQSSLGLLFSSPTFTIGNTGISFSYQVGAQIIEAETDRRELLQPNRRNNRVELTRYQGSFSMSRGFTLWQGQALSPTADAGLRFSPRPVVPYLQLFSGVTGIGSIYSQGDSQQSLRGTVGLQGQFGHFARSAFDFTGFNISYSRSLQSGQSPFLFDRAVDPSVLSGGLIQQIYGPVRIGFQTSVNLDTRQEISTDYILEYQRRTYGIAIRYNPVLQIGALTFRISDFNWFGNSEPFAGSGVRFVDDGIRR